MDLGHDPEKVRQFYSSLPEPATIGIEASARATWFENMLFETGHKLFVGNPVLIRKRATSRHKNDRRDAELILELLMRGEFPNHLASATESNQIIDILGLRQKLVRQRTQVYNRLQGIAHDVGLPKGKMRTVSFQALIKAADTDEATSIRRSHLFSLLEKLNEQINELSKWLEQKAGSRHCGTTSSFANRRRISDCSCDCPYAWRYVALYASIQAGGKLSPDLIRLKDRVPERPASEASARPDHHCSGISSD